MAGGIGFFALLGLMLWGVAAIASNGDEQASSLLTSRTFTPGPTSYFAAIIDDGGPIVFADLSGTDGNQTIVLDHTGDDDAVGWAVYYAHPADREPSCKVVQVKQTRTFTDCDGREIDVQQLAPPPAGVAPVVSTNGQLSLDLTPLVASQATQP